MKKETVAHASVTFGAHFVGMLCFSLLLKITILETTFKTIIKKQPYLLQMHPVTIKLL